MALTPQAALDLLRSPFAIEDLSSSPLFVVDATGGSVDLSGVRETLRALACVTVAVCSSTPPAWTAAFDVAVAGDDLDELDAALERSPMAALALVQLLRAGEALDVWAALFAESATYSMLQRGPEHERWLRARPEAPRRAAPEPPLLAARAGDRLHLTLNRPAVHNAFDSAMRDALAAQLSIAVADPTVAAVHLDGAGPSFCSGGDLSEFGTTPDPATAHRVRMTRSPARWMAACGPRTSVHAHGACIGAGTELAAFAADIAATEDAFFELPEVGYGLVPGAGGTVSLPRRIGRQRTAWLALSGRRIDAATARRWGLIDRVSERPRHR
jgi:enoyl-CoA hydratase/carnithine racemase